MSERAVYRMIGMSESTFDELRAIATREHRTMQQQARVMLERAVRDEQRRQAQRAVRDRAREQVER